MADALAELGFTFLRPMWLLGFIPLLLVPLFGLRKRYARSAWEDVVDPALHTYVIEPEQNNNSWSTWLMLFGWALTLLVLSGPVWEKQDVPVFQGQQAQVIIFDLSSSMLSDDIKPTRVARARFKLTDLLAKASGLQIALIAFAERPYVVSPLSDDANTIAAFVESLDPSIMPAQGSRLDLAIEQGVDLLDQAGVDQGQLVLITDSDVNARAIEAAANARTVGHKVSVIGVGTEQGAPLRGENGRFLQDTSGAIVVPQLKPAALAALAAAGDGVYTKLSGGEEDIELIRRVQQQLAIVGNSAEQEATNEYWVEYGPYAVLVILLLSCLFFRRGVI